MLKIYKTYVFAQRRTLDHVRRNVVSVYTCGSLRTIGKSANNNRE